MRVKRPRVLQGWHRPGSQFLHTIYGHCPSTHLGFAADRGGLLVAFLLTGQGRFKQYGLGILKWTMGAAFFFFAVLAVERFF